MKHQEKKYHVESFVKIKKVLAKLGAKKKEVNTTSSYYTKQKGNDVVKLVNYGDRNEIHILKGLNGRFSLIETIPVETTDAGINWLKDKGYKMVDIVKMAYTDYEYKDGLVGLYIIDDFLQSVILDFPAGQHKVMEREFGLDSAEVISLPYNKFLEQIGRLRTMKLI